MGIGKGENQIAPLYLSEGLVEMISCTILLVLWAPNVMATNLLRKGLLVVNPPKPHSLISAANLLKRIKRFWFELDRLALSGLQQLILPVAQRCLVPLWLLGLNSQPESAAFDRKLTTFSTHPITEAFWIPVKIHR